MRLFIHIYIFMATCITYTPLHTTVSPIKRENYCYDKFNVYMHFTLAHKHVPYGTVNKLTSYFRTQEQYTTHRHCIFCMYEMLIKITDQGYIWKHAHPSYQVNICMLCILLQSCRIHFMNIDSFSFCMSNLRGVAFADFHAGTFRSYNGAMRVTDYSIPASCTIGHYRNIENMNAAAISMMIDTCHCLNTYIIWTYILTNVWLSPKKSLYKTRTVSWGEGVAGPSRYFRLYLI